MATLIAIYSGRHCIGRCDAKCYAAKPGPCDCICGGKNHAAGIDQALDNTRDHCQEWLAKYAKEKGLKHYTSEVSSQAFQSRLFSTELFASAVSAKG